jgi:hypothetical protein
MVLRGRSVCLFVCSPVAPERFDMMLVKCDTGAEFSVRNLEIVVAIEIVVPSAPAKVKEHLRRQYD